MYGKVLEKLARYGNGPIAVTVCCLAFYGGLENGGGQYPVQSLELLFTDPRGHNTGNIPTHLCLPTVGV